MTNDTTGNIKDFINEHLVKILWGIALYFISNLSNDFKDVKLTLQQILINQATMEQRISNIENKAKQNSDDIKDLRVYHQLGVK